MEKEKLSRRFIAPIIFSILIVLFTIIYLININSKSNNSGIEATEGFLDLSNFNIDDKNTLKLDGEWEFYPNALLEPNQINEHSYKTYIKVPGDWSSILNENNFSAGSPNNSSANGSGTYRLIVRVPKDGIYSIKTKTIRSAARVYLNGDYLTRMGTVSLSREGFHRDSHYMIASTKSENCEIEIIIQASCFDEKIGGIIKSIDFGSFNAVIYQHSKSLMFDTLAFCVNLILSIFFIILYLQQREETYFKYFAFANFFMAVFTSSYKEQTLRLILNYNYNTRTFIQVISLLLIVIFITEFVNRFFNNFEKRKFVEYTFIIVPLLYAAIIYRSSMPIFFFLKKMHVVLMIYIMIRYLYIFYILIKEIRKSSYLSEYILLIIVSLFCYWIIMFMKNLFETDMGVSVSVLSLVLSINVWIMMSKRIKKSAEEKVERELQYFYSQISPHFLYNTLNTIIGLSYTDSEKTREALNNLSVYFRGKLDFHRTKGLVKLDSEIDMLNAYLEIEKLRYGKRLEIGYDIDENVNAVIPPLTLQPIIENAVKHGIAGMDGGGEIKISVKRHGNDMVKILIEDNGAGMSEEKLQEILSGNSERIGIKNVIKKIKIVKGASIDIKSEQNKGTKVEILLPKSKM